MDCLAPIVLAGHVQVDVQSVATSLGYFRCHGHTLGVQEVADDYLGAFLGKHPRLGGALTPRSAADKGYLAIQPSHNSLSLPEKTMRPHYKTSRPGKQSRERH